MATLTAPASARAVAAKRGLASALFKAPAQSAPAPRAPARSERKFFDPIASGQNGHLAASAPELAAAEPAEPKPPSRKLQKSIGYHERQMAARERVYPVLREVFPQAFGSLPPIPLAIGIHKQILEVSGDSIDPEDLGLFLKYWTTRRSYLTAVWRGQGRRNLDGSIAGHPDVKQRNTAGKAIWRDRYRPIEEPVEEKVEQKAEVAA